MLDRDARAAVFQLLAKGHARRAIARALKISRATVRTILKEGTVDPPTSIRASAHVDSMGEITELMERCEGNMARVHEELLARGHAIPYSTLTGLCREHGIGVAPKERAGTYSFLPGEEMQHDTSPHRVRIGDRVRTLQCAQLILCHSRMRYAQLYPVWDRFHAKIFLSEALEYLQGTAGRCMLDNSTVILAGGSGRRAVVAPEMEAFAERFGFMFVAHAIGDANRSARVERPFYEIETNFYPGREFESVPDANRQMRDWCERRARKHRRELMATPLELYAGERPFLKRLPIHIPEVYRLHHRLVDVEGYVHLFTNRYSAPTDLIGRDVEVRESKDRVRIFHKHREAVVHEKAEPGARVRRTLDEHRRGAGPRRPRRERPAEREERELRGASETLGRMVDAMREKLGNHAAQAIRRLHRMYIDYPTEPLVNAIEQASRYGLLDLNRIEPMVLRGIAGDYFKLSPQHRDDLGEDDHG